MEGGGRGTRSQNQEPGGQAVNRWSASQSAHMVKLTFPAEEDEHFPFLKIPTYSIQETLTAYQIPRLDGESDRDYEMRIFGITESGVEEAGVRLRTMTVPGGQRRSNILEVRPDVELVPEGYYRTTLQSLIPVLKAPEVLAVNSDFDEGRIDPATGYAIPDCDDIPDVDRKTGSGNSEIRLDTERDHLYGLYENDERVTDDLHPGWFGIHPKAMPDHFWDGAEVTIRKLDRLDPDTGRPECGQVRFYAKWGDEKFGDYYGIEPYDLETLDPVNLVTGGINKLDGESVYGSASQIPGNAQYWMEGVRPRKITLEWRLKKGNIDVAYEQTFLVETQQRKIDWYLDLRYMIKLQTTDDPEGGNFVNIGSLAFPSYVFVTNGFGGQVNTGIPANSQVFSYAERMEVMSEYYDFYRQCWDQDPALDWAGLARRVGNQVVGGVGDLQYAGDNFATYAADVFIGISGIPGIGSEDVVEFQRALMEGGNRIFDDIGWQHYAFLRTGLGGLEYVNEHDPGPDQTNLPDSVLSGWRHFSDVSSGLLDGQPLSTFATELIAGGRRLADYEQNVIVQPAYEKMGQVGNDGSTTGTLLSPTGPLSPAPIDYCLSFSLTHGGMRNIGNKEARWQWIIAGLPGANKTTNGVIKAWSIHNENEKRSAVSPLLENGALEFSRLHGVFGLPIQVEDGLEAPSKQ